MLHPAGWPNRLVGLFSKGGRVDNFSVAISGALPNGTSSKSGTGASIFLPARTSCEVRDALRKVTDGVCCRSILGVHIRTGLALFFQ
jgi:hypothetical protein